MISLYGCGASGSDDAAAETGTETGSVGGDITISYPEDNDDTVLTIFFENADTVAGVQFKVSAAITAASQIDDEASIYGDTIYQNDQTGKVIFFKNFLEAEGLIGGEFTVTIPTVGTSISDIILSNSSAESLSYVMN